MAIGPTAPSRPVNVSRAYRVLIAFPSSNPRVGSTANVPNVPMTEIAPVGLATRAKVVVNRPLARKTKIVTRLPARYLVT
jgi:hypothetical protein